MTFARVHIAITHSITMMDDDGWGKQSAKFGTSNKLSTVLLLYDHIPQSLTSGHVCYAYCIRISVIKLTISMASQILSVTRALIREHKIVLRGPL
jgi:hypothetical protein